jgi:DNA-binding FrmR family transcriptional regulator
MKEDVLITYLDDASKRALLNRVARLEGQIRAIRRQIESGVCADDLILLILSVRGAAGQLAAKIAEEHLSTCVQTCMRKEVEDPDLLLKRLTKLIAVIARNT